ncbi:molybdopterin-synthase adenylyltransferase MoeB [Aureimonas jatrophae]|uniref:Molybdopterin-synthase adenylyltransferase n=1 Tax=Aureimonas jatrophae TaxID=1166073 RepID=A0A1H0IJE6_9HYPH|nr:molybdopterin-synthase adenylyltransferase MoeB [Aureimonas jatrophae]MBB3952205.1 molybdopterin/thiamine biosynthesis adenylyltransferase [Aureimonas jatrophae]SDO31466.1 Molybdopterin or thiamine biosynthesis adenylyltransferase [Aureimonas jatrophae]
MTAPLSSEEIERYARHLVLPEIGGPGQQRLRQARVLLVGAGGLGSPAALYLAAAGVGTLGLIDDDRVSLSNLQRQILHGTADIGRPKLDSATDAIARINPHVAVETHHLRLDETNGRAVVDRYDLVVDGSDNFATRYALADLCERAERPLVSAAVQRFSGSLTVLTPFRRDSEGRSEPRYRDLFPSPPPEGMVPSCAEAGILGVVTGILGTLAAAEAIKLVTGAGDPLIGRLLLVDTLRMRFEEIRYRRPAPHGTQAQPQHSNGLTTPR